MQPRDARPSVRDHAAPRTALALGTLALATLAILWPLGLTNRVLAGIDAFTYFLPHWAYRTSELLAGRLPLWDPYLFLGAPFLANPQAAVLYPLHWPLLLLPPERALIWSAIGHAWLAGAFAYGWGRRSLGLSRPAAWLTGLWFGLGGFTLARVENINQLNALAWLPTLLWTFDAAASAPGRASLVRRCCALAVCVCVQLLAGHTQTSFINLVALGLYATWRGLHVARAGNAVEPTRGSGRTRGSRLGRSLGRHWLLVALPSLGAAVLAAAQLLPTIELNGLGLRTGGLAFRQAISFSLQPRLLAQSFLPPGRGGLAGAFGSEGYAEFVAYLGVAGLALAVLGLLRLLRPSHAAGGAGPLLPGQRVARGGAAALLIAGILLGLGAYDPLYYLLWRFVPGFDLFRAPARWLALYALGAAGLAGTAVDWWFVRPASTRPGARWALPPSRRGRAVLIAAALIALAVAAFQQWPALITVAGWIGAGVLLAGLLLLARSRPTAARVGLILLSVVELWAAGRALPYSQATAPAALSLRNAPAALLAAAGRESPTDPGRFISLSDIRFDPGDLAALRSSQAGALGPEAIERLVRAAKQMEVMAPNLPLMLRLPAVDGYDGGLLPLNEYVKLQSLFLPPGASSPDGRLREQLRATPPDRLLDLTGARFVVTDKQNDLWAGDVYYDLEQQVVLSPGESLRLSLEGYPAFTADAIGVVSHLEGAPPGGQGTALQVLLADEAGPLESGLAYPAGTDSAQNAAAVAQVARTWPDWMGVGRDYLAVLDLPRSTLPAAITLRVPSDAAARVVVRGLSLIDRRTGTHQSVTLSQRGDYRRIHSGDVKIYERLGASGRAWLVHRVITATGEDRMFELVADPGFDPRTSAVVLGANPLPCAGGNCEAGAAAQANADALRVVAYSPLRVTLQVTTSSPALLVLADAWYPGWEARVDGAQVPLWRTNWMFRGVSVGEGTHEVTFAYKPGAWETGLWISAAGLIGLALLVAASYGKVRFSLSF